MKMTKKRIIIGLFLFIIVIIWIIFYCFYPSKDQVGDEIYSGKYFDSAYDAYKDDDVYPYSKIEKELATININERFAMWIASTNHNEFIFAKMSLQNNQYCSLCDYAVIKVSNCNDPRLNEENTLGRNDIISLIKKVIYQLKCKSLIIIIKHMYLLTELFTKIKYFNCI